MKVSVKDKQALPQGKTPLFRDMTKNIFLSVLMFFILIVCMLPFVFYMGRSSIINTQNIKHTILEVVEIKDNIKITSDDVVIQLISNMKFQWKDYGIEDGYYHIEGIVPVTAEELDKIKKNISQQEKGEKKNDN